MLRGRRLYLRVGVGRASRYTSGVDSRGRQVTTTYHFRAEIDVSYIVVDILSVESDQD